MIDEFQYERMVQFADTDMAGIMHFSRYLPIMEEAEHALYRHLSYSVVTQAQEGLGWPRVHASCNYREPFRYEDLIGVTLVIRHLGHKSIHYDALFRRKSESAIRAHGQMIVVCVQGHPTLGMRAVEIPDRLRSQLQKAPQAVLDQLDQLSINPRLHKGRSAD